MPRASVSALIAETFSFAKIASMIPKIETIPNVIMHGRILVTDALDLIAVEDDNDS